jgi:DNA-directed RNA polymerase specialized sigma24 family protein
MQRRALELRVVDELAYAEIGELLSITPEGARTRVFRALDSLRNQIGRN